MSPRLIRVLRRLLHYAAYAGGGVVIAMCIVALAFRFWVMPNIAGYRAGLEAAATEAVGQPVRIGALEADWHGFNPRVTLRDVTLVPQAGEPLVLPRVDAVWSWLSLPLLDARLARLTLEQPRLAIRRDGAGVIYVAGIPVNVPSAPSPFPDWLLSQPRIVVKNAEVTWVDEKLDAPELRFSRVRLLLESRFGRHRFGAVSEPTAAAARRLEMRGDLKGDSVHQPAGWSGEAYARVDEARLENWGRWVPWAQEAVKAGVGSLRFWITVKAGQVAGLAGDANLQGVAINLQQDLPDMTFDSLTGHLGWARDKDSQSFYVERLRFTRPGVAPAEPASLRITLTPDGRGGVQQVGATASNLRLEAFTALTGALPLPRRGHDLLASFHPRGLVESAEGHWAGPGNYTVKVRMKEAGLRAYENFPGFSGLSFQVRANQDEGQAELTGGLALSWPLIFRHDLDFRHLEARAGWKMGKDGLTVDFDVTRLANADLEGGVAGQVVLPRRGAPVADIRGRFSRGEATAVYRYLPHKVADNAYTWLRDGLVGGHSDDVRLVLKGPLDRFPFDNGGGEFQVSVHMVDGALDYAPGWPGIRGVHGDLVFHDKAMSLTADRGRILDTQIGPVKAVIPDLHYSYEEVVLVDGRARGPTQGFLEFIRQSPVNRYTDGFTEPFRAGGEGELAISLRLPVRAIESSTVSGNYAIQDNRLDPGGDLPLLENVQGVVSFTDRDLQAKGLKVRILGQPATLDIGSAEGKLRVHMAGRASAEALKPHLPTALANRLSGATDWRADVGLNASRHTELTVSSDLTGLALDLPPPLGKTAAQSLPLSIGKQPGDKADLLSVRYGGLLSLRALLPGEGQPRMQLRLGGEEAPAPGEPGLWVSGSLAQLDLDAWRNVALPEGESPVPLREVTVNFADLKLLNRHLHDTRVRLRPSGKGWSLILAGREITGEIATIPEGKAVNVLANFKRLAIPEAEPGAPVTPAESLGSLRSLDLGADSVAWQGRELGELRLRLSPVKQGLKVEYFRLVNGESHMEGKGIVADHPRRPTRLELDFMSGNLGKLLGQLGSPGRLRGGEAKISGILGWTGGLEDFNHATLNGDMAVNIRQGQFLKVDPGAAKLLGILNLQALPRRIALDFRDVFTEGFAFDEIAGGVHLERGSAYAKDLRMNGPAAKIRMGGVVDLDKETQNLRFVIQPRLEDTVAVAGAILGGPVVGLGTLLASKVLKDPIGQAATFEYAVTGTWSEPQVRKIPRRPPEESRAAE